MVAQTVARTVEAPAVVAVAWVAAMVVAATAEGATDEAEMAGSAAEAVLPRAEEVARVPSTVTHETRRRGRTA